MLHITLDINVEKELKTHVSNGHVLHGSKFIYEQYENKVFIPRNHKIFANKNPILAQFHAIFYPYNANLHMYKNSGHTFATVIIKNPEEAFREGIIYVFDERDFIKKGQIYEKKHIPLLHLVNCYFANIENFKHAVYENNFKTIKQKAF